MAAAPAIDVSYFPGCSLATTAKENNQSLIECCCKMGINMDELSDWNCCGSSSAHSINHRLAFDLACRNLSLAPPGRPLVAACPSCTLRLKHAQYRLKNEEAARERYLQLWGQPFDPNLEVRHFFTLLEDVDLDRLLVGERSGPDRHDLRPLLRLHAQPSVCPALGLQLLRDHGKDADQAGP